MNKRRRFLVYPAGPIQGQNGTILTMLRNLRIGRQWTAKLFDCGFSPFPVFTDSSFLDHCEPVPRIEDVYDYSKNWLKKADAMLMLPGWEHSQGALAEIKVAEHHSIPIFYTMEALCNWADDLIDAELSDPITEAERILSRSDD